MQSFFIGTGAIVASSLPYIFTNWFNISNQAPEGIVPDSVKWSFYLGGFIFLLAVIWTVAKSREYSPEQLHAFSKQQAETPLLHPTAIVTGKQQKLLRQGFIFSVVGVAFTLWFISRDLNKELYIFSLGILIMGLLFVIAGIVAKDKSEGSAFVMIMSDLQNMPATMKQLAVVQFFSWFALFSMWIYMTPAVTSHLYGTSDPTSKLYNDGADWVGLCMGVYNGISALVAFAIPVIAIRTSRKITHMICLLAGGVALLSVYLLPDAKYLMLAMIGIGVAWASILSIPYAMLAGSLPPRKMGYFMGLFNFFIVIPQIVAAALLGFLIKQFFNGEPIYALVIGGFSMILAGLLSLRVEDNDDD
jgi:maltose/moltooligosaccharide transporter